MKLFAIGVAVAITGAASLPAQDLPAWVLELSRVKRHARESFQDIPNYTCQETIVRSARRTSRGSFGRIDTLHFQVASVAGKELLAPKGAGQFEDVDPSRYIEEGAIGTGLFSGLVRNLFVNDNALIGQPREAQVQSRAALAFDFEMTEFRSGYTVQSISGSAVVGLRGTFWVDKESLDLLQIEDHAVDIPNALGMRGVDSTIIFAPVRVGSSVVLLPQSAETVVTDLRGGEKKNATQFSACQTYTAESVIDYGKP
jgi:hypothetical protein